MDEIGEFIMELAERLDPQYKEIATNALDRWIETGNISPRMAQWIRRSAKFKGLKMPEELTTLISDCLDRADTKPELGRTSSAGRRLYADQAEVFRELGAAFARAADRLLELQTP